MRLLFWPVLLILAADFARGAGDPNNQRGDNPGATPLAPEEQLRRFHVPPGFEVQLVAAEPQIAKPTNLAFDSAGQLWVTCTELYPFPARTDANGKTIATFDADWRKANTRFRLGDTMPAPAEAGRDRVQVLSDFGPDGRARQSRTFADHLNIPIGVQPLPRAADARGDTAIVYSIPAIWRMEDRDGDGLAENRRALFSGFGFEDTHGMSSNYTYWLDGWIYGNHGHANHSEIEDPAGNRTVFDGGSTYRFKADGSQFERWTYGQTNPFGTAFDEDGNLYTADSHSKPVYRLLRGGYYEGIAKKHDGLGFAPAITKDPHGSTGIAGIAYYGADQFPAEFQGNLFNGNPITQRINRTRLEWKGASPTAVRLPDFLTCDDGSFRPVQVKLGPDGALYIADFYNPIIGHYEVRLTHPARDRQRGRIWRVVWRGQESSPAAALPDLSKATAADLLEKLKVHNVALRNLVVNELADRLGTAALPSWRPQALARLGSPEEKNPGEALGLVYALERFHALPALDVLATWAAAGGERGLGVLQVLANRRDPGAGFESLARLVISQQRPGPIWLALATLLGEHAQGWQGPLLLGMLVETPATDPQLNYALRLALKKVVAHATLADLSAWATLQPDYSALLADVCLAVDQPFVAEFLLAHLERTAFKGARVGDYVKHAASSLSADRFENLCMIARRLDPEASLAQQLAVAEGLGLAAKRLAVALPGDVGEWSQGVVLRALANTDAKIAERGLEASGGFSGPAFLAAWEKITLDPRHTAILRANAFQLLPADERGRAVAIKVLKKRPDARLLELITGRLGSEDAGPAAYDALAAAVPSANAEQSVAYAAALARTDAGATRLLALAEKGEVTPRLLVRSSVANVLSQRSSPVQQRVSALTANLPAESVRLDQVIAHRVANYRPARTDPINGAKLFAQNCATCHRFRDAGGNVGPSLDGIGVRGPARLFEDILDPSRNVDPAFQRATVVLKSGQEIVGCNLQATSDGVTLSEIGGKPLTFAAADVASTRTDPVSLMPSVFEQSIAVDDLSDVIAYLMTKD